MPYHARMTSRLRSLSFLAGTALLLTACPDNSQVTASDGNSSSSSAGPTTTPDPTTTTTLPTTTETPGTTTDTSGSDSVAVTDSTTTEAATTDDTSSMCVDCIAIGDEIACVNTPECRWSGVVSYTYSAQGCVGNITNFCVAKKPAGLATAMWRDNGDTQEVVEFAYTPECIGDEWKPCDCDGPLACLCTSVSEACPDRLDEFCAVNITELGCSNAQFQGTPVCHYFKVAPEGPSDDMCEVKQAQNKCLPATDTDKTKCDEDKAPLPPYPDANMVPKCSPAAVPPVYWKVEDDVVKLIESCGPVPTGYTRCESVDTPEQPDECGCGCL